MIAYKLMRLRKDGTLGPLFINAPAVIQIGVWFQAESHPTKGYLYRLGWHCTAKPVAPHLSTKGRVWVEVEVDDFTLYQRPVHQGGEWILAQWMKVNKIIEPAAVTGRA